jgi:hypothetical protein
MRLLGFEAGGYKAQGEGNFRTKVHKGHSVLAGEIDFKIGPLID